MLRLPLVAALAFVPTSVALAAPSAPGPDDLSTAIPETQIYGGDETEQCAWPSVVYLSSAGAACTGALVHPQIVLTAAHCVPNDIAATVRFGERSEAAVQLAETEFCRANPGFNDTGGGDDYGFCKLATPVTNIPVTPIAFGCEESILGQGTQITHVGYGVDEDGNSGRKKSVNLTVSNVTQQGEIITGNGNQGICSGDSGGPVMTKLRASLGGDDTWRVIGIHSWAQMANPGDCNGTAGSVIASRAIDFIEQESGIDVTPCFSPSGAWDPTWGCQGFPIDPGTGGEGSYNVMCETGPLGGFSEVCGNPLTDYPDEDAPTLNVLSPMGNQEFEVDGNDQADLHIEAEASDGDGWGIAQVELIIAPEGAEMVTEVITFAPYRWNTQFPAGAYNLKLIATDNAGNQTDSGWIGVGVGVSAPENPPGDDTGGDGGGSEGSSGDDGTDEGSGPPDDADDGDDDDGDDGEGTADSGAPASGAAQPAGCGCAATAPGDRGVALLTFVALGWLRRARRASSAT
jgi:V8-like Glu-specific endopeptidase